MVDISDDPAELRIAVDATTVLRRAAPFTETQRG
jgi:hypothetical protein